jgi:hypothetical protein
MTDMFEMSMMGKKPSVQFLGLIMMSHCLGVV